MQNKGFLMITLCIQIKEIVKTNLCCFFIASTLCLFVLEKLHISTELSSHHNRSAIKYSKIPAQIFCLYLAKCVILQMSLLLRIKKKDKKGCSCKINGQPSATKHKYTHMQWKEWKELEGRSLLSTVYRENSL